LSRAGVAPNQLFTWRRLVVDGALIADEIPTSQSCNHP